jgi:hypothetical protein
VGNGVGDNVREGVGDGDGVAAGAPEGCGVDSHAKFDVNVATVPKEANTRSELSARLDANCR